MKKNNRKGLRNRFAAGILSFAVALVSSGCSTEIDQEQDVIVSDEMIDDKEVMMSLLQQLLDAYIKKLEIVENKQEHAQAMMNTINERDNLLDKKVVWLCFENSFLEYSRALIVNEIINLTTLFEREKIDIGYMQINSVEDAKILVQILREKNLTDDEVCVVENIERIIHNVENNLEYETMLFNINTTLASDEMKIYNSDFMSLELLESELQTQEDLIVQLNEQLLEFPIYDGWGDAEKISAEFLLSTEQEEMLQSIMIHIYEIKRNIEATERFTDSKYAINDSLESLYDHEREVVHFEEIMHNKHFDIDDLIVIEASIDGIQEKDLYIIEKDSLVTYDEKYKAMLYDYLNHEHDDTCVDYVHFYTHSMKPLLECLNKEERKRYYKSVWYYDVDEERDYFMLSIDCCPVGISDLDAILERLRSEYKENKETYLASKTFDLTDLYVIEVNENIYIVDKISHFDVEYSDKFTAKEYSDLDSHGHDSSCLSYVHYDSNKSKMLLEYLTFDELKSISENENKISGAQLDEILQRIRDEYNNSKEQSWIKELLNKY